MDNINNIVRSTLNERYEIDTKLNLIVENDEMSDTDKFNKIADALADLQDKGKSDEEIDSHIGEGVGEFLNKFLKPGQDQSSSKEGINPGVGDFTSKVSSGITSRVREYLITYGLSLLGFKNRLSQAFASSLADLDLRYLIAMFRGGNNCKQYGAPVMDAMTEGIAKYMMYDIEEDSYAGPLFRNAVFEYFRASDFGEKMAEVVCDVIPKAYKQVADK
jgi:hypothetical protein